MKKDHVTGLLLAIFGACLWGTSGTAAEKLFKQSSIDPFWLVGLRLLGSGLVLAAISLIKHRPQVLALFKDRRAQLVLVVYAFLGMAGSQFTYFFAIKFSNAPTATVIEFLAPVFVVVSLAIKSHALPRRIDTLAILLAMTGTFFIATGGQINHLSLSVPALVWGLAAAVTQAINTVLPAQIFKKYGTMNVMGWSMLFSGLFFTPLYFAQPQPRLTGESNLLILYIIVFGTLIAYTAYLSSTTYILPSLTSMLGAFEPLTAAILSITLFNTRFGLGELAGGVLIIISTMLQVVPSNGFRYYLSKKKRHYSKN